MLQAQPLLFLSTGGLVPLLQSAGPQPGATAPPTAQEGRGGSAVGCVLHALLLPAAASEMRSWLIVHSCTLNGSRDAERVMVLSVPGFFFLVWCCRWDQGCTAGVCLDSKDLLRHPRLNHFTLMLVFWEGTSAPVSSVTPRLSPDRRGRNMRAAKPVFIYRRSRGQWCTVARVSTCSYPHCRGADHNSSLTSSSLLFFSSASFPKETLTTGHLFQAPTRSQTSPRASWLASTFPPNGKTAAGERRKKGRRCETHELMETGTPSTVSSLLHISGLRLNFHSSCSETIFPLLQFPGNPDVQAEKASDSRKTAADWDKNNYSSISLPRDTLSTSSSSAAHNEAIVART